MALKPLLGAEEAAAAAAAVQSASDAANEAAQSMEEVPTYQYQGSTDERRIIGSFCASTR